MTTEERYNNFVEMCAKIDFHPSADFLNWLMNNGFFTAPASTKYHGAYEGGLFDHSLAVTKRLFELTVNNKLEWQRKESPFIIGMFHDLCKCDQYIKVEGPPNEPQYAIMQWNAGHHYEYNPNTLLKGHGIKSVMILSQFITLTEEEMLCIRYHMGAYGNEQEQKAEWAGFDAAVKKTNGLCLWAHQADQLASKIDGI